MALTLIAISNAPLMISLISFQRFTTVLMLSVHGATLCHSFDMLLEYQQMMGSIGSIHMITS